MAEQEMLLDSATIKAAVAGEKWATEKVIEHYAPMIDELAVDEDMKQHLIVETGHCVKVGLEAVAFKQIPPLEVQQAGGGMA